MLAPEDYFPPYGLRITCGDLDLRFLRDEDLPGLIELVRGGVQAPDSPMPFLFPWHRERWDPGAYDAFPATSLRFWWSMRASMSPTRWEIALTVRHRGELVGVQSLFTAQDFRKTREVESGSWLGLAHQGKGIGTAMRKVAVAFACDELGAQSVVSAYLAGNERSAAVSRKVGYRDNGERRIPREDGWTTEHWVRVRPEEAVRPDCPLVVQGADELRRYLDIPAPR